MMNQKANFFVVPITLGVVAVVAIILGVCGLNWSNYVIGAMVGLLNHGLMVKQSARTFRFAKLDPEKTVFDPKKSAILWYILRFIVFIGVFVSLAFLSKSKNNNVIIDLVIALGGYVTMKIIFILCILCFKEKKVVQK